MNEQIDFDDYEQEDVFKCPSCFVAFEGSPDIGYFCPCCYVDLEFVQRHFDDE